MLLSTWLTVALGVIALACVALTPAFFVWWGRVAGAVAVLLPVLLVVVQGVSLIRANI